MAGSSCIPKLATLSNASGVPHQWWLDVPVHLPELHPAHGMEALPLHVMGPHPTISQYHSLGNMVSIASLGVSSLKDITALPSYETTER